MTAPETKATAAANEPATASFRFMCTPRSESDPVGSTPRRRT